MLQENDNIDPWILFHKQLLDMKVPDDLESKPLDSHEIEEKNKNIYWKIKGVVSKTLYRFMIKHGDPSKKEKGSELFRQNF